MQQVTNADHAVSRRDRMRAATAQEIKQVARRILVEQGAENVSLRGIARQMGLTAPALYRYFGSHEELIRNVVADIFLEIASDIQGAIDAAAGDGTAAKFTAGAREFRQWSMSHVREFGLLFGTPIPGLDLKHPDIADESGRKFADTFLALFFELWRTQPFPVAGPEEIHPHLRSQLERYRDALGAELPIGALLTFLKCWVRLYGIVSLEVFGHLAWALDDAGPIFEIMLYEMALMLGLDQGAVKARENGIDLPA